jgi:hypothetical protein
MPDFRHEVLARQHNLCVWRYKKVQAEARALIAIFI